LELKQIKDLMAAMGRTGTKRLRIKQDNYELELEREDRFPELGGSYSEGSETFENPHTQSAHRPPRGRASDIPPSLHPPLDHSYEGKRETSGKFITSPMVGTYYTSPGPDEPSFIKVGDKVNKDTVVCIIEAMKVMNEVKAGVEGTVVEGLVESGHPVEFGTKLYKIS
jgi:acetyl-CoA carboxylase biotin carboxyl carrier protein